MQWGGRPSISTSCVHLMVASISPSNFFNWLTSGPALGSTSIYSTIKQLSNSKPSIILQLLYIIHTISVLNTFSKLPTMTLNEESSHDTCTAIYLTTKEKCLAPIPASRTPSFCQYHQKQYKSFYHAYKKRNLQLDKFEKFRPETCSQGDPSRTVMQK
jgi:hypothetical protein